ncbi:glycerol-3-phosphate acyltransferase [Pseudalkalibacillus caeni]|uniref:Glycerol-3-phosphate acyltransferase n=1 Tax=Exobacillus caeni TaxID=2574798 RepID=A0A5R9F2L6_9BACL|nr:glycerol-3-phosphate acyltransferase [Pseudalkalibacillus caeni]TLS37912.1 glycerol-3-phosphate acyltransferase [Pseudalkalibacillus caeni]
MSWSEVGSVTFGYMLGCLNAAYYIVLWNTGKDIRDLGSRNPGARNAGRIFGKSIFLLTFFFDAIKGVIAIAISYHLDVSIMWVLLAGIFTVVGHIWPIQLRFRGGKGISVYIGVISALSIFILGTLLGLFFILYLLLRKFTLSGLSAISLLPFVTYLFVQSAETSLFLLTLAGLILYAHRKDIDKEYRRIKRGEGNEGRVSYF